jgi:fructose-1,6-bisphosphatase/inositol monophosphatase family enzyme
MEATSLKIFTEILVKKILEAGEFAIEFQGKVPNLKKEIDIDSDAPQRIKDRNQAKTEIDEKIQEMLLHCIKENLGTTYIKIDAEEDTPSKKLFQNQNALTTIVIDPIDGTLEYLTASDKYSINVGIIQNGQMLLALIYFPKLKKMYYLNEEKLPYEINYDSDLNIQSKTLLKRTELSTTNTVYVNNRVPENTIEKLTAHGFKVIKDDGVISWPEALLKCISGEYTASIFHTPQIRDILLGALIEKTEQGFKVDWAGEPISWPNGGRIPQVVFGTGSLAQELFKSLQ